MRLRNVALPLALLLLTRTLLLAQGELPAGVESEDLIVTTGRGMVRNSGGWGEATPLVRLGGQLLLSNQPGEAGGLPAMKRTLSNWRFWTGMAGTLAASHAVVALHRFIPGGPLVKTGAWMLAGFVGWEVGSFGLGSTDWVSLLSQSALSTLAYRGTQQLLGKTALFRGGPWPMAVAIGSAVTLGIVLDRLRHKALDDPLASRMPSEGQGGIRLLGRAASRG